MTRELFICESNTVERPTVRMTKKFDQLINAFYRTDMKNIFL